ncbi:MAG TPA: ARMT1-like domain-containing protein [Candidatus Bathyarchaeia archaeon]|nr:ARMT1-like domain-containing protein [Candidatus Bathyarchaeia archaeon]
MKVDIECAPCILHRGYMEISEATNDKALQFRAMSALARLLDKEFGPVAVPARLGTKRDRLVKAITGNTDPYAKKKWLSNQRALEVLPQVKRVIAQEKSGEARFRKACLCAIVGNVIEFDIPEHEFRFEDITRLALQAQEDLAVDEISKIIDAAKNAEDILYLTDNAGEIAFDKLLVAELKKLGPRVTVAVKGKPIINDATLQDAKAVGMQEAADDVMSTGTDSVGLVLKECSKRFISLYKSADLIVAKGMGHAETLTETKLTKPHALLLRTKCQPVARFFGTVRGKNVAKLIV